MLSSRAARQLAPRASSSSLLRASTSTSPLLTFKRSIQTTADSSSLVTHVPSDADEPFTIKLHSEYFQAYRCETPSLEMQVTKNGLVDMYKIMVTMRRMEMAADQVCCYSSSLTMSVRGRRGQESIPMTDAFFRCSPVPPPLARFVDRVYLALQSRELC